jgi:drug/metabolite transporter (DMT)-like permease
MIYLLLSILSAALLVVVLKLFVRFEIPQVYGIVYNYIFCSCLGWVFTEHRPEIQELVDWKGLIPSVLLGTLFFGVFNLIAASAKYHGIGITSIAFKLSFIIPAAAAIVLYRETLSFSTVLATILAVLSIVAISRKDDSSSKPLQQLPTGTKYLPFIIFIGAGTNDAIFNYLQVHFLSPGYDHIITAVIFSGAMITGIVFVFYHRAFWNLKYLFAGFILAVPNYASLYFLLLALESGVLSYSLLFPSYNLGIILAGVLIGKYFFGEKLNRSAQLGLLLAMLALAIVTLSTFEW